MGVCRVSEEGMISASTTFGFGFDFVWVCFRAPGGWVLLFSLPVIVLFFLVVAACVFAAAAFCLMEAVEPVPFVAVVLGLVIRFR